MMRERMTRTLGGLLCAVLLLASCAAGQKHVDGIAETQIADNGSPASIQATEAPVEVSKSDETYYDAQTAEAGPEAEPEGSPRESEEKEPDEKTTVGDVAIGALKVVGTVVLFGLYLGLTVLLVAL